MESPTRHGPAVIPDLMTHAGVRIRVRALPRLLASACQRRYAYHGIDTAVLIAAAIYYALHPGDASHELLKHLGVGDDILVLGLAARWFNSDIEEFLAWEQQQGSAAGQR